MGKNLGCVTSTEESDEESKEKILVAKKAKVNVAYKRRKAGKTVER